MRIIIGAVLKFKCIAELDRPLCAAIQASYQSDFPVIATRDDFIKQHTGQAKPNYDNLFKRFAATKSDHWAYEKEWRIVGIKDADDRELYRFESILPSEIESIYLGCRMEDNEKGEIIDLLKGALPHVTLFEAEKQKSKYGLEFLQIR